jgi:DeoR/GlpR family transcriptional regulator of sugar metabolism
LFPHAFARILTTMLTEERKALILERLRRDGRVLATPLAEELGISEDTVRRDLRELAADGQLKRVHGGALPLSRAAVAPVTEREQDDSAEKRALATAAARLASPGSTILLDGGTTNLLLARALSPELAATIVTTSPAIALALGAHPRLEVVLVGGRMIPRAGTVGGPDAVQAIRAIRADLCFLGLCSLDAETGITCAEREETFVKRAMIEGAGEVIALVTADKLDAAAAHVVAPASELTRLLVADTVPQKRTRPYAERGIEILRVRVDGASTSNRRSR